MKQKEKLHPVMFAGTGSDVGKSVITAAFCRIFLQDGYHPAPFKSQNMSLNSYATPEGYEIGRAQAVQAESAGISCHTDMNPVLLKPSSDKICQVILNGKPTGNQNAYEYFKKEGREVLRKEVCAAFDRLQKRYNPIVMEGAGSIAEINLRDADIVNMPMALHAQANVILVADIDRGGVFASVYGSILLLTEEERKCVRGIIINKFRGDMRLFESGIKMLENLCHIPVIGVIPYYHDIYIDDEDSVTLQVKNLKSDFGKVNIAVILLRHLSNFTDFNVLERDPRVHLYYTNNTKEIAKANIVLIPGSKSVLSDLCDLRKNGVAQSILQAFHSGATVIGICGGYQMMGQDISDPEQIEGDIVHLPGLGLLPVSSEIKKEKITRQVQFLFLDQQEQCTGYEIHMGTTTPVNQNQFVPLNRLEDNSCDGYFLHSRCFGTYIHGILDNCVVIDYILAPYVRKSEENNSFNFKTFKEEQYNKLADHVRNHVNMNMMYKIMNNLSFENDTKNSR
ncbi:MAG: cobyric acid synthase [Planctomycetaceae bacterium]|jgi:adenosylcobyric acid synthase|nr:cobyric acid synthase [Planctomycetaceae bacterium]